MHVLLVLLEVELLGLLHAHLDTRFGEEFNKSFALRHTLEGTEERQLTFFFHFLVRGTHLRFRLREQFGGEGGLRTHELRYAVLVFIEHLVLAAGHRTGDDKRRTGIVNQDGVHLIDDREVMAALHEVERRGSHVITQVVETELVVCSKSDIAGIGLAALVGVGFMLVDTIDGEAEEHVYRSVPLAITLGEVVVDSHHMHTFVRQGVEVHRQCGYEGLTFTGRHLGNLTLVQHDAAEELHIVMDHVPGDLVTAGHPVVLIDRFVTVYLHEVKTGVGREVAVQLGCRHFHGLGLSETTGGGFDDSESLRKNLRQHFLIDFFDLFLEFIDLVVDLLALLDRCCLNGGFQLGNTCLAVGYRFLQFIHQRLRTRTEVVIRQRIDALVLRLDLLDYRLNGTHVFLRFVTE